MSSLGQLVVARPSSTLISASFVLTLSSRTISPSFTSLVLLLTTIRLYSSIIACRSHILPKLLFLWISTTVATCLAQIPTAVSTLSTPTMSVMLLTLLASATNFFFLSAIFLSTFIEARIGASLSTFPAIWATVCFVTSSISPLGRLGVWSPVEGAEAYRYLQAIAGPVALDWTVGAWAVLLADLAGELIIGPKAFPDITSDPLLLDESYSGPIDGRANGNAHAEAGRKESTLFRPVMYLAAFLLFLLVPSIFTSPLPLPHNTQDTFPLTVACVLPKVDKGEPTLKDFIAETKSMVAYANIIIWPEGAVKFSSPQEKKDAIAEVQHWAQKAIIGMGFEDTSPPDAHSRPGTRRNGFVLLDREDTLLEYYKRHLVPLVESFSMVPSSDIEETYLTIEHKKPRLDTLTFPVTASICLDFAFPSAFDSVHDRPALILGPAHTWDPNVALAMWDQARARAAEMDSTVLWCDGGAGGVSGVAGRGMNEVLQVGSGSWLKTIGLERPFNARTKTLYGRFGQLPFLLLMLGATGITSLTNIAARFSGRLSWIPLGMNGVLRRLQGGQPDRREATTERTESAPLLA